MIFPNQNGLFIKVMDTDTTYLVVLKIILSYYHLVLFWKLVAILESCYLGKFRTEEYNMITQKIINSGLFYRTKRVSKILNCTG